MPWHVAPLILAFNELFGLELPVVSNVVIIEVEVSEICESERNSSIGIRHQRHPLLVFNLNV